MAISEKRTAAARRPRWRYPPRCVASGTVTAAVGVTPGRGNVDTHGRGLARLNRRRRGASSERCDAVIDNVQLEAAGLAQQNVVAAQPRLVVTGVVEGPVVGRGDEGAGPAVLGCCRVDADRE